MKIRKGTINSNEGARILTTTSERILYEQKKDLGNGDTLEIQVCGTITPKEFDPTGEHSPVTTKIIKKGKGVTYVDYYTHASFGREVICTGHVFSDSRFKGHGTDMDDSYLKELEIDIPTIFNTKHVNSSPQHPIKKYNKN